MKTFNLILEIVSIGLLGSLLVTYIGILCSGTEEKKTIGAKAAQIGYNVSIVILGCLGGPLVLYCVAVAIGRIYHEANIIFWLIVAAAVYGYLYNHFSDNSNGD